MSFTMHSASGHLAPDSPALGVTVSGNVQKYSNKKKKILTAEECELFELTQASGIILDQEVFKIILDLLKMNVAPLAVFQTLKAMCVGQQITENATGDVSTASQASQPHTHTEPRVRTKAHTEKAARDVASQRGPRQSSISRGLKNTTKSPGSNSS
ncbi:mitotic-spindle organizing protein 2 [Engraulis encrasicolus]|uniref:mitotic-spindle organizing protein 2 n=1 Tax=Engraulis encrasicolus TaxID=184585 RepID=UPI002FD23901